VPIHVTGFFREPAAFDALRTHVFPKVCQDRPRDAPIRVWVLGWQRGVDRTGLGLGLSISRKSVEADGGVIRAQDRPGVGCVFTIDLPRL
jgi:hypothetical protein